jgi:hypothetical protein
MTVVVVSAETSVLAKTTTVQDLKTNSYTDIVKRSAIWWGVFFVTHPFPQPSASHYLSSDKGYLLSDEHHLMSEKSNLTSDEHHHTPEKRYLPSAKAYLMG